LFDGVTVIFMRILYCFFVPGFKVEKNLVLNELKKLPTMHDAEYVENIEANIMDDLPEEEIGADQLIMP